MAVTVVAVLGSTGVLTSAASHERDRPASAGALSAGAASSTVVEDPAGRGSEVAPEAQDAPEPREPVASPAALVKRQPPSPEARAATARRLPADSGEGRRVVFSESRQRVWLVGDKDRVKRTYLVSGSIYDNLDPGTYAVYSRSEQAWGINNSGTMKYFVRFTQGPNAAIGFHDIPMANGRLVQRFDQLGTPLSHGCIRQRRADAIALWEFAPIGTTVVVTP